MTKKGQIFLKIGNFCRMKSKYYFFAWSTTPRLRTRLTQLGQTLELL